MSTDAIKLKRAIVLANTRSGVSTSVCSAFKAIEQSWSELGIELTYQFSNSVEDGLRKTRTAIEQKVDAVLVAGGDGMVNTIGSLLIGTDVALGVLPAGSGNGFARHFDIPLSVEEAAKALRHGFCATIDAGTANGRPFFVTCSLAWDGSFLRHFEKYPIRGVLPYILAGAQGFLEYKPQPFSVQIDDQPAVDYADPIVFTTANLSQYGGGARIAPTAKADDGYLELVVVSRQDVARVLPGITRLFSGTIHELDGVSTLRFRRLVVERRTPADIQVDGEIVNGPTRVEIVVKPAALRVLLPAAHASA